MKDLKTDKEGYLKHYISTFMFFAVLAGIAVLYTGCGFKQKEVAVVTKKQIVKVKVPDELVDVGTVEKPPLVKVYTAEELTKNTCIIVYSNRESLLINYASRLMKDNYSLREKLKAVKKWSYEIETNIKVE